MASKENVDAEYTDIQKCVPGPGVNLHLGVESLYNGCDCSGQCEQSVNCSCSCFYSKEGCLHSSYLEQNSVPIIECNSNCTCGIDCCNRTSQTDPCQRLTVVNTENKGMGVISSVNLQPGSFVGEYVGEIITSSVANERLKSLSPTAKCFIIQYREHLSNGNIITTNIDATNKGNKTRFINHSCEPNLIVIPIRSDSIVPRLCLFTSKCVKAGDELCFSYYGTTCINEPVSTGCKKCYCGSSNCIGYLPLALVL